MRTGLCYTYTSKCMKIFTGIICLHLLINEPKIKITLRVNKKTMFNEYKYFLNYPHKGFWIPTLSKYLGSLKHHLPHTNTWSPTLSYINLGYIDNGEWIILQQQYFETSSTMFSII